MKNQDIISTYSKYTLGVYPRSSGVVVARALGSEIWDLEGKRFLDFSAGIGVNNLGHCHPAVVEAILEQSGKVLHTSNQFYNVPHAELARDLCIASGFDRVFFSNSGAEANEAAIKIARKWGSSSSPNKNEIIFYDNSFHGRTLGTISATLNEKNRAGFFPLVEGFVSVPVHNLEAVKKVASERTAAIILEPVLGRDGLQFPPEGYLLGLRDLADRLNFVIIFDEMQSGIGRTGKLFYFQHEAMRPDILTLAKGLGCGVPIGATLCTEKVAQSMGAGTHGTTFGGNPLSTHVGTVVLSIISKPAFLDNVSKIGEYLINGLRKVASKHSAVAGDVRGKGLMIGMLLKVSSKEFLDKLALNGVLCVTGDTGSIRIYPALTVTKSEIDEALAIFDKTFESYAK